MAIVRSPGILLLAMALPAAALATESRKTALARSFLHVDDADLFLYPAIAGEWGRYAFVDAYTHSPDGDGGILLMEGPVFGMVFDHPAIWNDVGQLGTIYAGEVSPVAVRHIADLAMAFPSGHSSWGLMLGWGTGIQNDATEDPTDEGELLDTGSQANTIDLGVGWGTHAPGRARVDLGLGLTMNFFKQSDFGDEAAQKSPVPGVHLAGRFLVPIRRALDLGMEALLARRDYGVDLSPGGDGTYARTLGRFSIGPRVHPTERLTIGFFGRVDLESLAGEIDDEEAPSLLYLGVPGAGASVEIAADDHVTLRIGADYQHAYERRSGTGPGAGDDFASSGSSDVTTWGFGLGYRREPFALDLAMTGVFDLGGGVFGGTQVVLAGSTLFR